MCRFLGVASGEPADMRVVLHDAPRSLARLSRHHPDGWGVATFGEAGRWALHRGTACAGDDAAFHELALSAIGTMAISHVRQKTVGPTSIANTHPFQRGPWVFAHNGTVKDVAWLAERTSPARAAEILGDTDSERLFAWLLTLVDSVGAEGGAVPRLDAALAAACTEARAREGFGAFNFLLSDGEVLYAHRFGRTLYLLERGPRAGGGDEDAPPSRRRRAVLVASEHITDETWAPIDEGALLRIDRRPQPRWTRIG